jgi:TorA maturation chaperone TorD
MESEKNNLTADHINILQGYNMLLYFAGSMIMSEPTEECVLDFWAKGNLKMLPVSSMNPRFIEAAALLRDSCENKKICREMLRKDYNRLFAQSGLPLAPAYASVYLNNNRNVEEEIGKFYNSYGWEYKSDIRIAHDHLGIELLFLTKMVNNYLSAENDRSKNEIRLAIRQFIDLWILSWIPQWNDDINSQAKTLCYKGIATLIHACTEDIHNILATSSD